MMSPGCHGAAAGAGPCGFGDPKLLNRWPKPNGIPLTHTVTPSGPHQVTGYHCVTPRSHLLPTRAPSSAKAGQTHCEAAPSQCKGSQHPPPSAQDCCLGKHLSGLFVLVSKGPFFSFSFTKIISSETGDGVTGNKTCVSLPTRFLPRGASSAQHCLLTAPLLFSVI